MQPFRFHTNTSGPGAMSSDTELYGYLSLPSHVTETHQGVVLCNPFGQEAVRCHRMYRVLSERLARAGVACLRFDYFGTGDSSGDDEEVTLKGCAENTLRADQELRRLADCSHVSWLGLRFGAAVAAFASLNAQQRPDRLFLWDPVENGEAWIEQLKQERTLALQVSDAWRPKSELARISRAPNKTNLSEQRIETAHHEDGAFESQGFLVNAQLYREIRTIKPESYEAVSCNRLIVVAAGEEQRNRLASLEKARKILSFEIAQVAPSQWNSDEAISAAIAPQDVVSLVLEEMTGASQ